MNRPVQYLTYVEDTFSTQETDGLEQLLKENLFPARQAATCTKSDSLVAGSRSKAADVFPAKFSLVPTASRIFSRDKT